MKNLYSNFLILVLLFTVAANAQIPIYSSYPSAKATVYLDFDGQYVTGTSWNMSGPLTLGPANMSNAQVTEVFDRISEDYRPFNINITTDSTVYWAAPVNQRMRLILTISSSWYGSAGGVSYVNSFTWGDNTPAFVFTALLNYNTKNVAEAASHEIGHTLGLRHQAAYDANCVKTSEYNAGMGSGEIGWAPIMGVGYYRNFTLWNNGANPNSCTSYQDDLGIITNSSNGFGYRPDDFSGNANGGATQATFTNNAFTINGVIEKISDQDAFKFSMPTTGYFHLDAIPYNIGNGNVGSNLDIQVELIEQGNGTVGLFNPDDALNSSIDTMLNAGTYYIRVQGRGNKYAPEYASIGSYTLNAVYMGGGTLAVRKLELQGSIENNKHKFNWMVDADEAMGSQVLEVSTDGTNFQPVSKFGITTRSFSYLPQQRGILSYRLRASFENGKPYYSNTIALKNTAMAMRPFLTSNLVQGSAVVNSPAPYNYAIFDHTGKMVSMGSLAAGLSHLATDHLSSGMYFIRYTSQQDQYTERFMKQ
jgi:hypothetical protein